MFISIITASCESVQVFTFATVIEFIKNRHNRMNDKNPFSFSGRFCLFLESCRVKMAHEVYCIIRIYHKNEFSLTESQPECTAALRHLLYKRLATVWHKVIWADVRTRAGHTLSGDPFLLCFSPTAALQITEKTSRMKPAALLFSVRSHSVYIEQPFHSSSRQMYRLTPIVMKKMHKKTSM